MILPIDAADWEFVLALAGLRVQAALLFQAGEREASDRTSEEFRQTAARVGPAFKKRTAGLVQTAEHYARCYLAGEDVPRLTRHFAELKAKQAEREQIAAIVETPAKARSRRKKESVNELLDAPSGPSNDGAGDLAAPQAEAVQHPGPAARNAGPARRRPAAAV